MDKEKTTTPQRILNYKAIVFALSGALLVVCIALLVYYFTGNVKAQNDIKKMAEIKNSALTGGSVSSQQGELSAVVETDGEILPEYRELYEKNPNLVGWIKIPDTNVDYPIMQLNNEYYLYRGFDDEYSAIGLPFLDERCDLSDTEKPKLIYGHNTKSGVLFHDLLLYEDEKYLNDHSVIYFDTLYERRVYEVTSAERFEDRELQPELDEIGDTLMLITCSYHVENGRFAVYAARSEKAAI